MYYTVIKHSSHLRTLEKCRKHSPAARAFYISLVFSNACRVLSQCNTRLRLLYLLNKEAYHIKRSTPFLNNGLKASRELRRISWQFRFFVFHFHVVMLLYNLAVFKSLLPVSRLVRRWYRFISKYNNLITSFPCICCLSSLVTMQLLGIAFILNENNLESKLNWYFKCLVLMPATFRTSMQSLTVFPYINLIMPFSK